MIRSKWMALGLSLTVAGGAALFAAEPTTQPTPYPLKTCLLSGETLGEMGPPVTIVYEGREMKFCCNSCRAKFEKDPQKYMKELDAKTATTQPS